MFDSKTVPYININAVEHNDIEVRHYEDQDDYLLLNNGMQWMTFHRPSLKQVKEMYSQYDMAHGRVLLTGFGFGLLASWIASKPEVKSVTVVELYKDVVDVFLLNNKLSDKIEIVFCDASKYITNEHYDCVFLDHYEQQNPSWMFTNMVKISNNIPNHYVFWSWSLEEKMLINYPHVDYFKNISDAMFENLVDFTDTYIYLKNNILKIDTLPELNSDKINEYIYTYYDKAECLSLILN